MPITADPDIPHEVLELFTIMNRASDGYKTTQIAEASAQLMIAALVQHAKETGLTTEAVTAMFCRALGRAAATVEYNMNLDENRRADTRPVKITIQ